MLQQLKILIKAQAAEIRFSRHEERKVLGYARWLQGKFKKRHRKGEPKPKEPTAAELNKRWPNDRGVRMEKMYSIYQNLRHARVQDLKFEARHCQLAYGFLRGKKYKELESAGCFEPPEFQTVLLNALEFSPDEPDLITKLRADFANWQDEAEEWLRMEGNLNPVDHEAEEAEEVSANIEEKKENVA